MARIGSSNAMLGADDIEWATFALRRSDGYYLAPEPAIGPTGGMIPSAMGFVLDDPDPDDDDDDEDVFPDDDEEDDREDDSDDDHDL